MKIPIPTPSGLAPAKVDIKVGEPKFSVTYDPKAVTPEKILEALRAKKESVELAK